MDKKHVEEIKAKLIAKYDKKDELTPAKRESLNAMVDSLDKREAEYESAHGSDKDRELVLKMWKRIERREAARKG